MTQSQSAHTDNKPADKPDRPHPVTVIFDDDPLPLPDHKTTPNAMLGILGLATATHYVVRLKGRERESFQGRGDEEITVHDKERFVSVSTEPTPTS
jgi:hypothetical protein